MNAKGDSMNTLREKVVKCVEPKLAAESVCAWANRGFECFRKEGLSLG